MFQIPILIIIFLTGLIVGSFLNCLIYRLALPNFSLKNLGGLTGRSFCPHCKHQLSWQDLIPLLSFLFLKGKCRYCQKSISRQYPLVELATAILFVSIFRILNLLARRSLGEGGRFDLSCNPPLSLSLRSIQGFWHLDFVYYLIIASLLIVIFVYDFKHYLIPDKIIYPAIVTALIFNFQFLIFNQFSTFIYSILSALGASLFFLLIVLISKGKWMGVGDIKLAFFMGLFLGFPKILIALFFAFFVGALIGIALIIFGKKTLKSEVPFGPFLVSGTFFTMFVGEKIIDWYLNLFL